MKSTEPLELKQLYSELVLFKTNLTKTFMLEVLKKRKITSKNKEGTPSLYPITIYEALQGSLEFGPLKAVCYLINGSWYILDSTYGDI